MPTPSLQMTEVTAKLKGLHAELEKTHRGEDKYLTLVTEEHSILKEERDLLLNFQQTERQERECFSKVPNHQLLPTLSQSPIIVVISLSMSVVKQMNGYDKCHFGSCRTRCGTPTRRSARRPRRPSTGRSSDPSSARASASSAPPSTTGCA